MQHSSGPHERPGTTEFHAIDAHDLRPGQRLLLPDGKDSAEVLEVDTVLDDYGQPALYFAVLDNHTNLRVAHGTRVRAARGNAVRPADLLFAGPAASAGASAAEAEAPDAEVTAPADEAGAPAVAPPTVETVPAAPLRGPSDIALDTGEVVHVPGAASARPERANASILARLPAPEDKPEDLMRAIDAAHPGRHAVHELAARLARGVNVKSGACLADLRALAYELYIGQRDAEGALKVADLLAVLPYDGNPARWASIESALGLAAHLAREAGQEDRAAAYGELLRTPEDAETDPFRARMAQRVRQRALNEPNLYDKEITRAVSAKDHAEERGWRMLRLGSLLHLRAHGGSTAFEQDELDRRIEVELDAVRA
ncbi:DUF6707 family protein [Sinomonas sp. R1AF57]|uniref:DUF6707 family protein n=1 Tax=Sinomonas sp. R1AF57 TaxID=2020377 RepID=UPI000B61AC58|nr:DUF6707 family protein [Sinomonas sp. R1AF57]ASN50943.1 hypothetical protein CGQ25_01645 [Sinomonas sp. R1AF57]